MKNPPDIEKLVEEVGKGKYGSPNSLKKNLGEKLYNEVQEKIIENFEDKTIKEIISEINEHKYGIGEGLQLKLGYMYEIVQNQINKGKEGFKEYKLNERQIQILAERAINEEFEDLNYRRELFGTDFIRIGNKINEIKNINIKCNENLLHIDEYINKLYTKEISNEELYKEVGETLYNFIRNKVNEKTGSDERLIITKECIEILADLTIILEFGIHQEREEKLGELYHLVQNRVNEKLNCSTRFDVRDIPKYVKLC